MNFVFDNNFFKKHQKTLLFLLNAPVIKHWFRWVMRIRKQDLSIKVRVDEIMPNAFTFNRKIVLADYIVFKNGNREIFDFNNKKHRQWKSRCKIEKHLAMIQTTDFRTHAKYAKRLYYAFYPLWALMHAWDLIADHYIPGLSFGFSTLTVFPVPGTTVDGNVGRVASESWSSTVNGNGTQFGDSNNQDYAFRLFGSFNILLRSIFLFDTSALTTGATISAAVLSLVGYTKQDPGGVTPNADIYTSAPASNTGLANGDYQTMGGTSQTGSPVTYANLLTDNSTYVAFTFNATGIGNVSKTGISKFGCRNANKDVANVDPTANDSRWGVNYAEATGTSLDPKLVVTYSVPQAFTRSLSDSILNGASRSVVLGRLVAAARSNSDSVMNGASRSATLSRIEGFNRALSDSIMNAASRFAVLTKGYARTLSDSIMNGAGRSATLARLVSYFRTPADSILNGASRSATVARLQTLARSLSDSIMNGAGRLVTVSKVTGLIRSLSDSITNGAGRLVTLARVTGFIRAMSDSILNGASRTVTVSRVKGFVRSLSDSIMVGASRLTTLTRGVVAYHRALADSIMNGALRYVVLTVIAPLHTLWIKVTITATNWIKKDRGT